MATSGSRPPSQLIREARARAGLTQEQLAIRAGTKPSAISRLEKGHEEPSYSRLQELLLVMGFELSDELVRRPIPADYDKLHHNLSLSLDERADVALAWNEFGGELSLASEQIHQQELQRLVEGEGSP